MSFWTSLRSISVGISLLLVTRALDSGLQFEQPDRESWRDCRRSHPIGSYPGAGCEPLGDRGHRPQGPIQNAVETVQGEPVDDLFAPTLGLHESAVPKARQVCGNARLRLLDCSDQLCDCALTVLKELEDPEPRRIAQDAEEAGRC